MFILMSVMEYDVEILLQKETTQDNTRKSIYCLTMYDQQNCVQ